MKSLFYIVLCCIAFFYSCRNNTEGKKGTIDTIPVLDIEYTYENADQADTSFLWNNIIKNEQFIPLETTEECLIGGGPWNVTSIKDNFLVFKDLGTKESIYLFDSSGNFIKTIARNGKGPGELFSILINVIPFQNDQYILLGAMFQNIIKDQNGNLIRDLKSEQIRFLYPHNSGFVHINQYDRFPNDSTLLCFTDSLGNIIKELKEPPLEARINPNLLDSPFNPLNKIDDRKLFFYRKQSMDNEKLQ